VWSCGRVAVWLCEVSFWFRRVPSGVRNDGAQMPVEDATSWFGSGADVLVNARLEIWYRDSSSVGLWGKSVAVYVAVLPLLLKMRLRRLRVGTTSGGGSPLPLMPHGQGQGSTECLHTTTLASLAASRLAKLLRAPCGYHSASSS
jgi:hypothetical protein